MLDVVVSTNAIVESSDRVVSKRFPVLHKDKLSLIFAGVLVDFEMLKSLDKSGWHIDFAVLIAFARFHVYSKIVNVAKPQSGLQRFAALYRA